MHPRFVGPGWVAPAARRASFSADGVPEFLNQLGVLKVAGDWDNPDVPRLWRYNLHYFDDLNALAAESRVGLHRDLITRWIAENPAPVGTGWEPYPCSLRIVNWVKWALSGNQLEPSWRTSLTVQADWLSKNLEWHLLGNHLFANAKALVFAGTFFEGEAASAWLTTGLDILARELPEQVLADGGQFERSPMYHAIALEDVLDLINLARAYPGVVGERVVCGWREAAGRMLGWARVMTHPDREIVQFNDSAFGIAPVPSELEACAARLGVEGRSAASGVAHLPDTGYVRAENESAVLFADVGEIGPDYLPGHAHADTLSFELSLFGSRWIVDTGCSTYEVGDERLRQRGTGAHNTVIVDGQDSSEVWSSFRVARRARPGEVRIEENADGFCISASHNGYRRLPGRVTHHRTFQLGSTSLLIKDRLEGTPGSADAYVLFHPDVRLELEGQALRVSKDARSAELTVTGGEVFVENATWHPEFGLSLPCKRIRIRFAGKQMQTDLTWVD